MPTRQNLELGRIRPLRLFVIILIVLFALEIVVMFVLPHIIPSNSTAAHEAFVDSCLLTGVVAPLLWYLIVKPLQNLAATRRRLLAQSLSAQESERRRIARDLHDGLGQALTGLMIGIRTIEESSSDPQVKAQARELRRIGGDVHDEVRRLARGLRPAVLDDLGLTPALERFLGDLNSTHQIETHFEQDCDEESALPDEVKTSVYRIVQEAAANAVRHGKAKILRVQLSRDAAHLHLQIDDDGCGFDAARAMKADRENSPFGLLSIHERACLLGGEAAIASSPGSGTRIRVRLPLKPLEKDDA